MDINDVIPAVDCSLKMVRNGDYFQIKIVGKSGQVFQEFKGYTLTDGDALHINGLGFKVTFDGIDWTPPMPSKKVDGPHIYLKRKMDIEHA